MESLEDIDLVRSLNFRSTLNFLNLVELELAGLVLAAQGATEADHRHFLVFPPLKPRYASLLQVAAARFGLSASLHGWGDERRTRIEASPDSTLPAVQCADFLPGRPPTKRLREIAVPALPLSRQHEDKAEKEECKGTTAAAVATNDVEEKAVVEEGSKEQKQHMESNARRCSGGMRGWGSDDESDDDWIAKRRKSSSAAGGAVARGRGFVSDGGEGACAGAGTSMESADGSTQCSLQKDYTRYEIDPNDTWSPHRKPYVELDGAWEFSGAWSFDPDENEQREDADGAKAAKQSDMNRFCGVAAWRVEHTKGGNFTVALASGNSGEARRWLQGSGGPGEEPFVLEFRLDATGKRWEFCFGRSSKRQSWRSLPWSNAHRTSFWLASVSGDDGKQHLTAGFDEFPERRFFFAKVRMQPRILGFGPPAAKPAAGNQPFFIRDIVVFGRQSLLAPPFASRDHLVEVAGKNRQDVLDAFSKAALDVSEPLALEVPRGVATLLVCRSPEDAQSVAAALEGAIAVRSSQWTWPVGNGCADDAGDGVAVAQAHRGQVRESWAALQAETTRELAIFEEHLQRKTKHLEGLRIARTSATRMILSNLKGEAPLPKPPDAGV